MNMGKIALKYLFCLICWCFAVSVQALTLSNIELRSYLNQPLDARVGITGINADDLENLDVGLLESAEGPASFGPDYLNAEIVNDTTGQYIRITSKSVVREPVITFTLELSWPAGRLQREFLLLIDPKN
jgi:pilus assembly protein FimV